MTCVSIPYRNRAGDSPRRDALNWLVPSTRVTRRERHQTRSKRVYLPQAAGSIASLIFRYQRDLRGLLMFSGGQTILPAIRLGFASRTGVSPALEDVGRALSRGYNEMSSNSHSPKSCRNSTKMCLLAIAFQTIPDCPAFIFANREEAYSRPSSSPQIHAGTDDRAAWLGGEDLLAGGTWLAINQHGLLVAVTNRPKSDIPDAPRSRGLLCRELAGLCDVPSAEEEALRQLQALPYAGCNLLLLTGDAAVVIEAGDEIKRMRLPPGLHVITNGALDDPHDCRIARVRAELASASLHNSGDWTETAKSLCGESGDADHAPICLTGRDRGTVSSTIVALRHSLAESGYWHAAGPPSRTSYTDLSPELRTLANS